MTLRFGIEALDCMIQRTATNSSTKPTSGCIVGPDGCGKSLLALHLASAYAGDCTSHKKGCRVIYVSTDYSYEQAEGAWNEFGLGFPKHRAEVLKQSHEGSGVSDELRSQLDTVNAKDCLVPLLHYSPLGSDKESPRPDNSAQGQSLNSLLKDDFAPQVSFLDLQRESVGDDWTFLTHLIGLLPKRKDDEHVPLLIVDAVEGLETLVGQRDAFGERRSRRSRVAELSRACVKARIHIVFIVEEAKGGRRLPEQFVTDFVVRTHLETRGDSVVRTL